uniref:Centromere protein M n=1 Tax=Anser brachyrhynchus TaxID=132585 RepID=A0A8B9BJM6_9AVES
RSHAPDRSHAPPARGHAPAGDVTARAGRAASFERAARGWRWRGPSTSCRRSTPPPCCHLATSLPLPAERDHLRPRIDLIVFIIDIKSKYSLKNVEASLAYVDASFFLGKVCFLVTGVGRVNNCSIEMNAIWKLRDVYCSPVLLCELEVERIQATTAQRLLRMLQICAGHVPGVSALTFGSLMRSSADD